MPKNSLHIISKCLEGDDSAQRELYKLYRVKWYMLSLRYSNSRDEAADIMQEGLICIFNDLHQFDSNKGRFVTWSSRVLVNAALRYLKKHSWNSMISYLDHLDDITSNEVTIVDKLSAEELTTLLQKLPTGYRIVFNMYAIEGYSHKEIANHLGIAEGTSKSQLAKARKALREKLEIQLIHK